MEIVVGVGLALAVAVFAAVVGFDRDRAFYPTVLVIVASYYGLFAVMGDTTALGAEMLVSAVFIGVAVIGFRTSPWVVAAALASHGVFDLFHGRLIDNPGVPAWWPVFCLAFDVAIAGALAWRLVRARPGAVLADRFGRRIRPHVQAELDAAAARERAGDPAAAFEHLERAHVLGQASTVEHVRVHIRMLLWGLRQRRPAEIRGQILRIIGAAALTPFGLIPRGNTGGANISPFRPVAIPPDLARLIAVTARSTTGLVLIATLVGGIALLSAGTIAEAKDVRLATVEGRQVAYRVLGSGQPVVVMIAGLGDGMAAFKDVAPQLAQGATVIVYDRAGYGDSDPAPGPRDAAAAARELSGLLAQTGVSGPYVLVGHSNGGLIAEYYAAIHPDDVASLILAESRPADFTRRCEAAGLGMCVAPAALVRFLPRGARDEFAAMPATMDEVLSAGAVSGRPVLVLSRPAGERPTALDTLWTKVQDDLAARYPGARHLTAPAGGHYLHRDQLAWFVAAVRAFLDPRVG